MPDNSQPKNARRRGVRLPPGSASQADRVKWLATVAAMDGDDRQQNSIDALFDATRRDSSTSADWVRAAQTLRERGALDPDAALFMIAVLGEQVVEEHLYEGLSGAILDRMLVIEYMRRPDDSLPKGFDEEYLRLGEEGDQESRLRLSTWLRELGESELADLVLVDRGEYALRRMRGAYWFGYE